jgi:hypothetical protein
VFRRPTRYFIEYTPRAAWEKLHRTGNVPADPDDYRAFIEVTTLRAARKQARELLDVWPFTQPEIRRRTAITAVSWDYSSESVDEEGEA